MESPPSRYGPRDWIRRNAWYRIGQLWAAHDPEGRALLLKSRLEFEGKCGPATAPAHMEAGLPETPESLEVAAQACLERAPSAHGLQERLTFASFVVGPANEFAHAVASRVASWSDGHFNPVIFHGPYGFGKTHLLNALAWEAMRVAPGRKVVYLNAERFLSGFIRAVVERRTSAF